MTVRTAFRKYRATLMEENPLLWISTITTATAIERGDEIIARHIISIMLRQSGSHPFTDHPHFPESSLRDHFGYLYRLLPGITPTSFTSPHIFSHRFPRNEH
jgi:hypothetical protein